MLATLVYHWGKALVVSAEARGEKTSEYSLPVLANRPGSHVVKNPGNRWLMFWELNTASKIRLSVSQPGFHQCSYWRQISVPSARTAANSRLIYLYAGPPELRLSCIVNLGTLLLAKVLYILDLRLPFGGKLNDNSQHLDMLCWALLSSIPSMGQRDAVRSSGDYTHACSAICHQELHQTSTSVTVYLHFGVWESRSPDYLLVLSPT